MNVLKNLNAYEIQRYQQNRYPLLFVDEIVEAYPGQSAKGVKCFSYNEWFFPAHFEDEPVVPGFVQIEALTQVFLMSFLTLPEYNGKKTGFISVKNRFWKKIVPGQRLDIEATLNRLRYGLAVGISEGYVDGALACRAELEIAIPDVMGQLRPRSR